MAHQELRNTALSQASAFDESLFTDGSSLWRYEHVRVFNGADEFLAKRVLRPGQQLSYACSDSSNSVNVNPSSACHGHNLYTLDSINKPVSHTAHYRPIFVCSSDDCSRDSEESPRVEPLRLLEAPDPRVVYDASTTLTNFEAALILKYFAIRAARGDADGNTHTSRGVHIDDDPSVRITEHLYATVIEKFARDGRAWFLNRDPSIDIAEELYDYEASAPVLQHLYEDPIETRV